MSTQTTLQLYVRSLKPTAGSGAVETALDRIERLHRDGYVADYDVEVWGRQVPTTGVAARTDAAAAIRDRVTDFRRWAAGRDVTIEPFFEERTVESDLSGESYTAIVLPNTALAETREGSLHHVTPYRSEDGVVTVTDRLTSLSGSEDSLGARSSSAAD